jgi:hypothetical protein
MPNGVIAGAPAEGVPRDRGADPLGRGARQAARDRRSRRVMRGLGRQSGQSIAVRWSGGCDPCAVRKEDMHDRPRPRTEGIVTERVDDDLVVYDQESHQAHCLSGAAVLGLGALRRRALDGGDRRELALEPELVERALGELSRCGLLDEGPVPVRDYSRREAAVRLAKVGGAAFTAPLIYSVVIGSAAAAASCKVNGVTVTTTCSASGSGTKGTDATCCSGTCYQGSGSTKTCVPAGCSAAGLGCVVVGNTCCSGTCTLLFCQN